MGIEGMLWGRDKTHLVDLTLWERLEFIGMGIGFLAIIMAVTAFAFYCEQRFLKKKK